MEPGHSQDQVNGSPPRPASRRGWMSDSPLDGGSGWPTSAYSIVPRQSTGPERAEKVETPEPEAVEEQPAAEPVHEPLKEQDERARNRTTLLLVIGLMVLLAAAVGGILAVSGGDDRTEPKDSNDPGGQQRAVTGPPVTDGPAITNDATGAGNGAEPSGGPTLQISGSPIPGSSPAASADPSGVVNSPLVEGAGTDVLRAGTVRLAVIAGQPEETFDFDAGTKQASGADVAAGTLGLTAKGGAQFAAYTGAQAPKLADCGAIPAGQWTDRVLLGALLPTAKVCVRTSDQRFAWFTPRLDALAIGTTYLDFTVWKKAGD